MAWDLLVRVTAVIEIMCSVHVHIHILMFEHDHIILCISGAACGPLITGWVSDEFVSLCMCVYMYTQ